MKIKVKRIYRGPEYTIGHLYVNDVYVCDTLEDRDRGLDYRMSLSKIKAKKIAGKTAIPTGTYRMTLDVKSPKFGSKAFYREVCDGYLPRLIGVPGYDGVLIHVGNTQNDTDGCILVGLNKVKGQVIDSRQIFRKLWDSYFKIAKQDKMGIVIEIV